MEERIHLSPISYVDTTHLQFSMSEEDEVKRGKYPFLGAEKKKIEKF